MFEADCPYYLSIGMTYEQYWYGDVWMVEAFREADRLKQKRKNQELWLQGMYIYEALCDASPLLHAFAKKGTKAVPYREAPYDLFQDQKQEKPKQTFVENERMRAELYFRDWAKAASKRFKKQDAE